MVQYDGRAGMEIYRCGYRRHTHFPRCRGRIGARIGMSRCADILSLLIVISKDFSSQRLLNGCVLNNNILL